MLLGSSTTPLYKLSCPKKIQPQESSFIPGDRLAQSDPNISDQTVHFPYHLSESSLLNIKML